MKIRTNDIVKIMVGKDKGKTGKVLKVFKAKDKVIVEGINMVKRHVKPGVIDDKGGIISIEKPIHVSNVMYMDKKANRPVRIGFKVVKGKKVRVARSSGEVLK